MKPFLLDISLTEQSFPGLGTGLGVLLMLACVSSQWPFEEDVAVSEEIWRGMEEVQTCMGVHPMVGTQPELWDISGARPPVSGPSEL